ncbi:uncharacterized protein LOC115622571 [Scaptodrosophila lebanonensis]|uniref:Uncharacterized protein LOC115622571 n=1 Tax=Drosophila lebanonensis TaxID=7225 RepID=A0A6J2TAN0_DROLE|nr:uncharacterized protein LOC115622571 [Scaptodrosophila lebanonensis]
MPRTTCRPSERVANGHGNDNGNDDSNNTTTTTDADATSKVNNNNITNGGVDDNHIVKQEFDAAPPVCHRKSERRRVARDIFLVFEEQPARRRGRGGARGKSSRTKQKFGHLKVASTPRFNKNLLREIKTEPKCTATAQVTTLDTTPPALISMTPVTQCSVPLEQPTAPAPQPKVPQPVQPPKESKASSGKQAKARATAAVKLETKTASNAIPAAATAVEVAAATVTQPQTMVTTNGCAEATGAGDVSSKPSTPTTPSVNPIFLWVKQDDTRIVEVRCEDYDKRNRIRLTKTTNGWRSMPRTDASSTRIVKFFHSAATPLMKVKREVYESQQQPMPLTEQQQLAEHTPPMLPSLTQNLLHDWNDTGTQLPDEDDEERDQHQDEQHSTTNANGNGVDEDDEEVHNLAAVIENVVVRPAGNATQSEPMLEATPTMTTVNDVCFDALLDSETNASTKATKTSTNNTSTNTPTYQSSTPSPMELQLCPKTGLFLPKGDNAPVHVIGNLTTSSGTEASASAHLDMDKSLLEEVAETLAPENQNKTLAEHNRDHHHNDHSESLDANTKNLKDLLDDADLLQNCSSDNGSSGADLLDSLVKRSCEDNLVQNDGTGETQETASATDVEADGLSSFCVPDLAKDLPSILDMDNDAPKCLSFNEAGEIEGLNGDLFQETHAHSFGIDAFEKEPDMGVVVVPTPATVELTQTPSTPPSLNKDKSQNGTLMVPDETPKDLSYKKREEVCPPSESRSQCAVTSSSDILKSPEPLELESNSIPAEVETTSETIKHLILEQFLKLNALNQLPSTEVSGGVAAANNSQQAEPMDLGKARDKLMTTASGKYLETVVIDDEEETPPLKKRSKANIKMDKDPDALTQLKMLIANPQWKVPDPILVPKDRLGAVLASPAREIPLLLTTRPELRLPEAFAYPEIIQNPNILVVTMEQLEAILKNEHVDQAKTSKPVAQPPIEALVVEPPTSNQKVASPVKQATPSTTLPHKTTAQPPKPSVVPTITATPTPVAPPSPADSSVSTDLNATTLALLQQMLWLPYFGQLSQEFFKTFKDPMGLQRKFMNNLMPLYNNQFGLQHLDELYKHCLKQKATEEQAAKVQPTPPPTAPPPPIAPGPANFNGFSNPVELAIMQKLLQPQMSNFLGNWSAGESTTSAIPSGKPQNGQQHQHQSNLESSQHHHLEHKRARRTISDGAASSESTPLLMPEFNNSFNKTKPASQNTQQQQQQQPPAPAPAPASVTAPAAEHKPRLTCKSLSNLLDPESSSVPLLNVPFDSLRRAALHKSAHDQQHLGKEPSTGRTLRSSKACVTYNPLEQAKQQQTQHSQQQRKRGNMLHDPQQQQHLHQQQQQQHMAELAARNMNDGSGLDSNSALWHPLFGSNPKQGYNSPWQWTTVTATGE